MRYLFVHQNMPGQYKHIVQWLAQDEKNEIVFITNRQDIEMTNVRRITYGLTRHPSREVHHYMIQNERGILYGQAVARKLMELKQQGWIPDIIVGHPGWGELMFAKDVFPNVPVLSFFEFYYRSQGSDVGFDPKDTVTLDDRCRIRTKNFIQTLALETTDAGMAPTRWQFQQYPEEYRYKIKVVHDGVDTSRACPDPEATFELADGTVLTRNSEVITYVARNLEPYRGFPTYMAAVEQLQKERPNATFVVVGGDEVSYGRRAPDGKTYREIAMENHKLDLQRVHFVGKIPYSYFLRLLQVSSVHVYLTYPFVLSWSMIEAMSAECLVVGSATPPAMEVIQDGYNGLLVDFFSAEQVVARVCDVLDRPELYDPIRKRARETVLERYDLRKCLNTQLNLIQGLIEGYRPVSPAQPLSFGEPAFTKKALPVRAFIPNNATLPADAEKDEA